MRSNLQRITSNSGHTTVPSPKTSILLAHSTCAYRPVYTVKWTDCWAELSNVKAPDPRVSHFGVQLGAKTGGARTTKVDFTLWVQDCLAGNDGPAEEAETLTR
jgi:hypothetical protein